MFFSQVTIVYFRNWPFDTTPDTQKKMPLASLLRVPFPLPTNNYSVTLSDLHMTAYKLTSILKRNL